MNKFFEKILNKIKKKETQSYVCVVSDGKEERIPLEDVVKDINEKADGNITTYIGQLLEEAKDIEKDTIEKNESIETNDDIDNEEVVPHDDIKSIINSLESSDIVINGIHRPNLKFPDRLIKNFNYIMENCDLDYFGIGSCGLTANENTFPLLFPMINGYVVSVEDFGGICLKKDDSAEYAIYLDIPVCLAISNDLEKANIISKEALDKFAEIREWMMKRFSDYGLSPVTYVEVENQYLAEMNNNGGLENSQENGYTDMGEAPESIGFKSKNPLKNNGVSNRIINSLSFSKSIDLEHDTDFDINEKLASVIYSALVSRYFTTYINKKDENFIKDLILDLCNEKYTYRNTCALDISKGGLFTGLNIGVTIIDMYRVDNDPEKTVYIPMDVVVFRKSTQEGQYYDSKVDMMLKDTAYDWNYCEPLRYISSSKEALDTFISEVGLNNIKCTDDEHTLILLITTLFGNMMINISYLFDHRFLNIDNHVTKYNLEEYIHNIQTHIPDIMAYSCMALYTAIEMNAKAIHDSKERTMFNTGYDLKDTDKLMEYVDAFEDLYREGTITDDEIKDLIKIFELKTNIKNGMTEETPVNPYNVFPLCVRVEFDDGYISFVDRLGNVIHLKHTGYLYKKDDLVTIGLMGSSQLITFRNIRNSYNMYRNILKSLKFVNYEILNKDIDYDPQALYLSDIRSKFKMESIDNSKDSFGYIDENTQSI